MKPIDVEEIFARYSVLQRGHFALSSGMHSDVYLQCARVLEYPRIALLLGEALAQRFRGVDVVTAPAVGAILIGSAVAQALDVRFLFAERVDGRMMLRRGQRIAPNERVLVVEDVVTTGGSAGEVVALCNAAGGAVVGVGALVDRTPAPPSFRMEALLRVAALSWPADDCPMCEAGTPIESPGSRKYLTG